MSLRKAIKLAATSVLEVLYPPKCVVCGRVDRLVPGSGNFCRSCLPALPLRRPPDRVLECCMNPKSENAVPGFQVVVAAYYEGHVRDLLLRLKFLQETGLHAAVSALCVRALYAEKRLLEPWPDVVAAVPLHRGRLRERGFNQAGLIAADIAREIDAQDLSGAIVRVRATQRQSAVSDRQGREANVAGAFRAVDPLAFRGRSVLLVDDVLTSGATMLACAREVSRFSPSAIYGTTAACGRAPTLRIESVPHERYYDK